MIWLTGLPHELESAVESEPLVLSKGNPSLTCPNRQDIGAGSNLFPVLPRRQKAMVRIDNVR
jgi:hypothetical protein